MTEAYELGRQAFLAGRERKPMGDHALKELLQSKHSADHHPSSPGAELTETQRRAMEKKINDWKRGWDICRGCEDETCISSGKPGDNCPKE